MLTTCSFSKVGFSYFEIMKRGKKGSGICTFLDWIEHTGTCSMSRSLICNRRSRYFALLTFFVLCPLNKLNQKVTLSQRKNH